MIGESTIIKQALAITLCIAQIGSGSAMGTAVKIKEAEKPLTAIESTSEEKIQQTVVEEVVLESIKEPAVYVPQAGLTACGYCGGSGHDEAGCRSKVIDSSEARGAIGRWVIPEVGVDVAAFDSSSQSVVDAADSAGLFYALGQHLVADHNYQGFNAIKSCRTGMEAYLETSEGRQTFICTGITTGTNVGNDIITSDGRSISKVNRGGYTCYTCNENRSSVTIVFFTKA